jgi:hypothetical protein
MPPVCAVVCPSCHAFGVHLERRVCVYRTRCCVDMSNSSAAHAAVRLRSKQMPIQAMQYPPAPPPVISMPGPMPAMAPPMGRYDMQ